LPLSTRLLLEGVADHCSSARDGLWTSCDARTFRVGRKNVAARPIAFVEAALDAEIWNEAREHQHFIARIDTVSRFGGAART
jgi:hypothetical protein